MHALRHHLKLHRWLTALVVGTALLIRILVPAGFMPVFSAHGVTIELCSGFGPAQMTMAMAEMPGSGDHDPSKSGHNAKEMPCGFGGLSVPSLSAADPILLAVALRYIMAAGLIARTETIAACIPYLRPPSCGPPLTA